MTAPQLLKIALALAGPVTLVIVVAVVLACCRAAARADARADELRRAGREKGGPA